MSAAPTSHDCVTLTPDTLRADILQIDRQLTAYRMTAARMTGSAAMITRDRMRVLEIDKKKLQRALADAVGESHVE